MPATLKLDISDYGTGCTAKLYPTDSADGAALVVDGGVSTTLSLTRGTQQTDSYTGSVTGRTELVKVKILNSGSAHVATMWAAMKPTGVVLGRNDITTAQMDQSASAIARCVCTSGGTTISIPTSSCLPAGASLDQYKGRILIFAGDTATAALRGQGAPIDTSSNAAAPTFTLAAENALNTAPASGDQFVIL